MTTRVAINGFGRIGRNILRAIYESQRESEIQVVAINDLGEPEVHAHLFQYDTAHGRFQCPVALEQNELVIANQRIPFFAKPDPKDLPWADLNVDIVFECTGHFASKEKASAHLTAGAKQVLISAPAKDADITIVYGVNDNLLKAEHKIVSNASCTTNCLAPMAQVLHKELGIEQGLMTTIHAFTNDQQLNDVYHNDLRRARSATQSMIPTQTGAAQAVGLVLPELDGKLDGMAVRVPTINVSLVDFSFVAAKETTSEAVNGMMRKAIHNAPYDIMEFSRAPLVSCDFNHNSASCVFDSTQTKVKGNLVKVMAWYDNEWGFSNRMLDTAKAMYEAQGYNSLDHASNH